MTREGFLRDLSDLANRAEVSDDSIVSISAVVLFGLKGAVHAGPDYLDAFVQETAKVIGRQLAMITETKAQGPWTS